MMSSRSYWREREAEALQQRIADEEEYDKKIVEIYKDMLDATQKEIEAFYGKYADKEGITIADAKKRVSKVDIEAYERKAQRYVEAADRDRKTKGETDPDAEYFSETADEEMRLYNLTMKVNRLELLKANIGLELVKGHAELESYMGEILQGRTMDELERQAGILGQTIKSNAKKVHAIVNASFHNAAYSDRIWMHQDLLKNDLAKLLQSGLIQGKNPRELARELKKKFDVKASDAERLMRTELARVQTEAQKQSFERNDYEEYEFIVNSNCCPICAALDGKHFKVEDMMPGENAPPMHPNCRCSIAAYEDSEEYEAWLDHLEKGGTTEEWENLKEETVEKSSESSTIRLKDDKQRNMANGQRRSPFYILNDDEISALSKEAESIGIPLKCLSFNTGNQTGFIERTLIINIRGDVLPDTSSNKIRDLLSSKAVLAHEYYGHYMSHPSAFRIGDWRDEFRASYNAAINTPNLTDEERRMLMLDAYDRAREAGVPVKYNKEARRLIYGYDD